MVLFEWTWKSGDGSIIPLFKTMVLLFRRITRRRCLVSPLPRRNATLTCRSRRRCVCPFQFTNSSRTTSVPWWVPWSTTRQRKLCAARNSLCDAKIVVTHDACAADGVWLVADVARRYGAFLHVFAATCVSSQKVGPLKWSRGQGQRRLGCFGASAGFGHFHSGSQCEFRHRALFPKPKSSLILAHLLACFPSLCVFSRALLLARSDSTSHSAMSSVCPVVCLSVAGPLPHPLSCPPPKMISGQLRQF